MLVLLLCYVWCVFYGGCVIDGVVCYVNIADHVVVFCVCLCCRCIVVLVDALVCALVSPSALCVVFSFFRTMPMLLSLLDGVLLRALWCVVLLLLVVSLGLPSVLFLQLFTLPSLHMLLCYSRHRCYICRCCDDVCYVLCRGVIDVTIMCLCAVAIVTSVGMLTVVGTVGYTVVDVVTCVCCGCWCLRCLYCW